MKAGLVATPITDKLGRQTTVYKRPEQAKAGKSSLAAAKPTVSTAKQAAADKKRDEAQKKVDRLLGELELGVEELMTSEGWQRHLDTMAHFHHYSLNNQMLIRIQMPQATQVASYRSWGEVGRQVNKGEKSLAVLAPLMVTVRDKDGNPILDDSGREKKFPRGYRAVPVFDISQTSGEELPEDPTRELDGDAPFGMRTDLTKFLDDVGYKVEAIPGAHPGINGSRVVVDANASEAEQARTMAHELGRVLLGHLDPTSDTGRQSAADKAVEAESFAYVVCRAKGLRATGDHSFGHVSTWAHRAGDDEGEAAKRVREHGNHVAKAVKGLLGKTWPNTDA